MNLTFHEAAKLSMTARKRRSAFLVSAMTFLFALLTSAALAQIRP